MLILVGIRQSTDRMPFKFSQLVLVVAENKIVNLVPRIADPDQTINLIVEAVQPAHDICDEPPQRIKIVLGREPLQVHLIGLRPLQPIEPAIHVTFQLDERHAFSRVAHHSIVWIERRKGLNPTRIRSESVTGDDTRAEIVHNWGRL